MAAIARSIPEMMPAVPATQGELAAAGAGQGWGYAILLPTSFQDDSGAGLNAGIVGSSTRGSRAARGLGHAARLGMGASRALDYLETDKAVDGKQVGSRATPGLEKRRWWPWRTIPALPLPTSARPVLAATSSTGMSTASSLRISPPRPLSTIGCRKLLEVRRPADDGRPAGRCP